MNTWDKIRLHLPALYLYLDETAFGGTFIFHRWAIRWGTHAATLGRFNWYK